MKAIKYKVLLIAISFCFFSLNAFAEWFIVGEGVPGGSQVVLTQNPDNPQEFLYTGKLTNQQFKISDGTTTYIHDCGDNDPLGQSTLLRAQTGTDDIGLRIRYVGEQDFFRVKLTVGRIDKRIFIERVTPPKYVYIMGGPFNTNAANWLLEDAVVLEKDTVNPFVFYYRGDIRYNSVGSEGGNIKFLVGRSWRSNYHPAVSGNVPLNQASKMRLNGEDNKWTIPSDKSGDGHYLIKLNTLDNTISVLEFIPNIDLTPLAIFITGDAMPSGWTNSDPIMMRKTGTGTYQWQGNVNQGQFKFLQRKGTWEKCYVATSENEMIQLGMDHNLVYEENYMSGGGKDYKFVISKAGNYNFLVDLNSMKLRIGEASTDVDKIIENLNRVKVASHEGKLYLSSDFENQLTAKIYSIDGRNLVSKSFVKNTEIALPKGFYIVLVHNDSNEKLLNSRIIVY